jgi:hypothetical protein
MLARILKSSLATVGEAGLMSLEAFADVPMASKGVLAESISVACAGHPYLRDIPSALLCGRPGRAGLRVSAGRNGKEAAERHNPTELPDAHRSLAVTQFGDPQILVWPVLGHVLK